jgi:hypothetical protein
MLGEDCPYCKNKSGKTALKTTPELRTVSKMFPQFFFFPQKLGEIFLQAENL